MAIPPLHARVDPEGAPSLLVGLKAGYRVPTFPRRSPSHAVPMQGRASAYLPRILDIAEAIGCGYRSRPSLRSTEKFGGTGGGVGAT